MSSTLFLPNETICNIISFLHPQDVDNFTSTRKLYYDISIYVRDKHLRQKKLYYKVDDNDPMIIPFLVAHPELAWYVRRLIIRNERHNFGDWIRTEDSLVRDQSGFGDGTLPNSVIIKTLRILFVRFSGIQVLHQLQRRIPGWKISERELMRRSNYFCSLSHQTLKHSFYISATQL